MRTTAIVATLIMLATACSGGGDATPTLTASQIATLSPTILPTPPGLKDTDYWFLGVVTEVNRGCQVDARCTVTVEVTESLGGVTLPSGQNVTIIEAYGFSPQKCYGSWGGSEAVGDMVTVLAHDAKENNLAICDDDNYFVSVIGAVTPTSEPAAAIPTLNPTPPSVPTCAPDIDCAPLLRTVNVHLWSCDGGPCDGNEDSDCHRAVYLQFDDRTWQPDPFDCVVQFHSVPTGEYLLWVDSTRECGSLCDPPSKLCNTFAWQDYVAVVPAEKGTCPLTVMTSGR